MTNPYYAMCAELLVLAEESISYRAQVDEAVNLIDRARALLAQPESIEDRIAKADAAIEASMERIRAIAAAPARDLAQPVPVSEHLPRPENCDADECWCKPYTPRDHQ